MTHTYTIDDWTIEVGEQDTCGLFAYLTSPQGRAATWRDLEPSGGEVAFDQKPYPFYESTSLRRSEAQDARVAAAVRRWCEEEAELEPDLVYAKMVQAE
jgi:hypothetical protein